MRFFKVLKEVPIFWGGSIKENDIICFSKYFSGVVICSDGRAKTRFVWAYGDNKKVELLISGRVRPLTEREFNKIKPHLRKEHFIKDI